MAERAENGVGQWSLLKYDAVRLDRCLGLLASRSTMESARGYPLVDLLFSQVLYVDMARQDVPVVRAYLSSAVGGFNAERPCDRGRACRCGRAMRSGSSHCIGCGS